MSKVSIIMPTYNNGQYISSAIKSVLSQSFQDFELLVIDDGSNDDTAKIVSKFNDQRIIYVRNLENKGLIYSLNLGLNQAKGELIARLDADDEWVDLFKLEKQVEMFDDKNLGLVGTFAKAIDENGKKLFLIKYPAQDKEIRNRILIENCFIHSSVLFNKRLALKCGGYNASDKYVEDYALWMRMGEKALFANIPEIMVGYRINRKGETLTNNHEQILNNFKIIKACRNKYPNYIIAILKWGTRFLLANLLSTKLYWKLKTIIK